MSEVFEPVSVRVLGSGVFLKLEEVRLRSPEGSEVVRDIVRHPGGVAVLPLDGDDVWLIRQHRAALGISIDEIPAGKLDPSDVDLESAARRELAEELGATAARLTYLTALAPSPGYTDEVIHVFVAQDLTFSDRNPDGAEEVEATVFSLPLALLRDRVERGEVIDAKTQLAVLHWNRRQK